MQRVLRPLLNPTRAQCRKSHTASALAPRFAPVQILPDASLETFRRDAFDPAVPALLPRGAFGELEAREKWFVKRGEGKGVWGVDVDYLGRYGDVVVPLEVVSSSGREEGGGGEEKFERVDMPLSVFLEYVDSLQEQKPSRHRPDFAECFLFQSLHAATNEQHTNIPRPAPSPLAPASPAR